MVLLEEVLSFCDGEALADIKESVTSKIEAITESVQARAIEADSLEESVKEKDSAIAEKAKTLNKAKAILESIKKDFNRNKVILEKQTELKEEAEAKIVILERDMAEVMKKVSILEGNNDELMSKISEEEKKDKKKDDKGEEKEEKPEGDEKKDDEEKKDEKKKESVSVSSKIRSFYIDAKRANPSLREHRKEILACKELKEAQEMVLKLTNKVKESVEPEFEKVEEKAEVLSVASITEQYRKNWGLGKESL